MKIHKHNVAMRWITRRRTNEVAGLYESFPGTFSAYQEALSGGFQGTMEEFIQQQSIPQSDRPFTGAVGGRVGMKPGGLVEPGVTHYATRGGVRGDPSDPARQFTQKKNKWNRIKTVIDEVDKTGDINILKSQTRKTGGKLTMNQANILSNASTDPDVFNEAVKFLDMDRKELRSLLNKREANIADVKVKAGTKRALTLPDIQLQNQMHKIVMKGASSVDDLAKELKISKAKALDIADKLYTNIYATRVEMGKGKYSTKKITPWLPKKDVAIDKLLKNLGNTKGLRATQQENIGKLFYNAFGRETLPNGKKNLSYNPKKYKQTLSKLAEYNRIVELLPEGIKLNLDHPLSKMALKNMNASADQLVRVTPISESLNKGLKLKFDTAYANALKSKDVTKQKAVQKLAKQLGINIGKVTKGGVLQYGVKDFRNLDLAQTVIDNLKQQNVIAENIRNVDPDLKKAAGLEHHKFNLKKISQKDLKTFETWIKKFPCKRNTGGPIDISCHIEGMRHEKNLLNTGKGTKAMANKFIEGTSLASKGKFANASRLFLKGTVVGDLLFEGGYAAYNYLQGMDAADIWKHSWYSFMDPKLWKDGKYIGWVSDADQAKLYTRKDGSIMPEIKRYVDNANLVQKHLDLYNNVFSASLQDPTIQFGWEKEASKKVTQAKTDLDLFNEEIYKKGGMNKIIGELEQDQKAFSEREEVIAGRKEQAKKDVFEKWKSRGAFSEDREFHDMSDAAWQRKYDQAYKDMEAANPFKSVFSSPESMADYFVSDEDAQSYIKANYPLSYGHVSSKRIVPAFKQNMFRRLREDPKYNQYIHSMSSAYDPTLKGTQYNTGGRVGFKVGGIDKGRRAFMKWVAGLTGAGVAAGTGILKLGKGATKTIPKFKGTPNLVVDITKTPNMPDWYIPLIKKVLNKGDEVTDTAATASRERVHRDILPDGDEVIVTQNIDNQTIGVHVVNPKDGYRSASGAGETPYQIQYSKGKVIEEGKYKGQKEADTLEVDEPYVAHRGPDDSEIEFDISTYNPKAEVHDTSVLESYATGKKVKPRGTGKIHDPYEGYSPDLKADDYAKGGLASYDTYLPRIDDVDY